jgi:hypothetical protein
MTNMEKLKLIKKFAFQLIATWILINWRTKTHKATWIVSKIHVYNNNYLETISNQNLYKLKAIINHYGTPS